MARDKNLALLPGTSALVGGQRKTPQMHFYLVNVHFLVVQETKDALLPGKSAFVDASRPVSYTHLRAHETRRHL
eukprot:6796750-Prorocentrum_lima.AAC.1